MAKNIVICCDGTGNEFGESKSNVVKLYKMLVHDDSQVAYYNPGVGTMGARSALTGITRWWTKVIGLAFGYGISDLARPCRERGGKRARHPDLIHSHNA